MTDLTSTTLSQFMAQEPSSPVIDHKHWCTLPPGSPPPSLSFEKLTKFRSKAQKTKRGCIVLAAGQGTRFRGPDPKVVSNCNGKPLGSWVIGAAISRGLSVVVVIGWEGQRVSGDLGKGLSDEEVVFVMQEKQMGTGHAVGVGLNVFGESWEGDVMVTCGDCPGIDGSLIGGLLGDFRKGTVGAMILTGSRRAAGKGTAAYGRIVRAGKKGGEGVVDIVEKKQIDRMGMDDRRKYEGKDYQVEFDKDELDNIDEFNSGIYVAKAPLLFDAIMNVTASRTKVDPPKYEYYATDFVKGMVAKNITVQATKVDDSDIWKLEGANTVEELHELEVKLRDKQK